MCRYRLLGAAACLWLLSSGPAFAQDAPTLGLVIGAPAHVGLLWQVSERVAVRPDFSWSWSRTEATGQFSGTYEASTRGVRVSPGIGVLFRLSDDERLQTYLATRYGFSRSSTSSESDLSVPGIPGSSRSLTRSTQRSHSGGAAFGARYAPGSRFGVFGEFGLEYSSSSGSVAAAIDSTSKAAGTRAGVGVILFF